MVARNVSSFGMVPLELCGHMVRYVPNEDTLISILCFRKSYEKNTQHKRQNGFSNDYLIHRQSCVKSSDVIDCSSK